MASREQIFWTFCIPFRIFFTILTVAANIYNAREMQILLAIYTLYVSGGLFQKFVKKLIEPKLIQSMDKTENEKLKSYIAGIIEENKFGNFGGPVWWQNSRLVHSTSLLLYSILTFFSFEYSYIFTIIDVSWAICVGIIHFRSPCQIKVEII